MWIDLERHARSMNNSNEVDWRHIGDMFVPLARDGPEMAKARGRAFGAKYFRKRMVEASPYLRTRLTFGYNLVGAGLADESLLPTQEELSTLALEADAEGRSALAALAEPGCELIREYGGGLKALRELTRKTAQVGATVRQMARDAGVLFYEDARLREVEMGIGDVQEQILYRQLHSYLLYRMEGGESPLDGYDRVCTFLESLLRQSRRKKRKKVLLVSHGLTMRCFAMRFMHLSVEEFNMLRTQENCGVVTIGPKRKIASPQFISGKHAIVGLNMVAGD